jgi:hypothetical protein
MVVELPYSLHGRYASIAIAWTIITIPPVFINLGLFYGLWYGKPSMDRIAGELVFCSYFAFSSHLILTHMTCLDIDDIYIYITPSFSPFKLLLSNTS